MRMNTGWPIHGGKIMNQDNIPKKELGQHWLKDKDSLKSIIELADLNSKDVVLEIGPGMGSLTEFLIETVERVVAVEFDESLLRMLNIRFHDRSELEIINQDIRKFDLNSLPANYKCVANIPYYLTSYLIRMLSQSTNAPQLAVLLIQQEVAQRLAAKPGQLSLLAVMAQSNWEISLGPVIPAALFTPPPKVNSQIIKLIRRDKPLIPKQQQAAFIHLVKIGFSQKRKTLLNSLSAGLQLEKEQTRIVIEASGLKTDIRPQELTIDQWLKLTKKL